MIEPAASLRLQRVRDAYESSLTPPLRSIEPPTARCGDGPPQDDAAGAPDRSPSAPLADGYVAFRERSLGGESVAAAFLATIAAQAEALALVWEAHARGAVTLPPPVAAAVSAARSAAR